MVQYLLKSERHLAQYLACNLLSKGYVFYATSWIPEGKDPLLTDAKLLLLYESYLSKERQYRRSKAGFAKVRYLRCGRLVVIMATKGKSAFFQREDWAKITDKPLHVAGYKLSVNGGTGKVSVRIHDEARRKLRREWMEDARGDLRWWEERIWNFEFLPFAGVRDGLFALIRDLNISRKHFRKPPIDWRRCVRKKFTPVPVFLDSPPEILEVLEYHRKLK